MRRAIFRNSSHLWDDSSPPRRPCVSSHLCKRATGFGTKCGGPVWSDPTPWLTRLMILPASIWVTKARGQMIHRSVHERLGTISFPTLGEVHITPNCPADGEEVSRISFSMLGRIAPRRHLMEYRLIRDSDEREIRVGAERGKLGYGETPEIRPLHRRMPIIHSLRIDHGSKTMVHGPWRRATWYR